MAGPPTEDARTSSPPTLWPVSHPTDLGSQGKNVTSLSIEVRWVKTYKDSKWSRRRKQLAFQWQGCRPPCTCG